MSVFIRRFTFDPGDSVLLNIESVNILDLEPPSSIAGVGTGTVLLVGEFENGPYKTPTEVTSATDLVNTFGGFGFSYGGVSGQNPCARARLADGTLTPEYWNGNGFIQLSGKQFARLVIARVDTSVGAVQFTPLAYVTGASAFRYTLSAGQVLGLDVGSGPQTATFNAAAATLTSQGQTFATGFTGGETLTLGVDGLPNFTVTFLSADQTQAAVISRINQFAGFAMAASATSTTMTLSGLQKGLQGQVRVVGASGAGVLTTLGLATGTTYGTGNVADIAAVTPQEVAAIVQTAITNTLVETDQNGALRISNTLGTASSFIQVTSATTAAALGFTSGQTGTQLGVATVVGVGGVASTTTAGTFTLQFDGGTPFDVTLTTSMNNAAVVAAINTAAGKTYAYADGGQVRLIGKTPGGSVNIVGASAAAVLSQLGLAPGYTAGAPLPLGTIPAGTVVQDTGATRVFVTTQDVVFTANGVSIAGLPVATAGPYVVRVRHALDDGTGGSANAGTITKLPSAVGIASFSVLNPQGINAALSEAAVDAAYVAALGATIDLNTVAREVNIVYAARQSNTVRRGLRQNAIDASGSGCFGRMACVRPPLGTAKAVAKSANAEPGVGAYRNQRVVYCYPGARTFVPAVATVGAAGGAGFSADGNLDVGADGFLASILSQLPPEENPGQETPFTSAVISVESSANAQGFTMTDYIAFKAAGICALRVDGGVAIFQSGVTSVDPAVNSGLVRISRRRMADFCQDSISLTAKGFGKKLSTVARRKALETEIRTFLGALLSIKNPTNQRIAGFTVDAVSGNTAETIGMGLFRIIIKIRTLSSLDSIVLQTTVGEQVEVAETLPEAA